MKKIIALFTVLALAVTSAFALPGNASALPDNQQGQAARLSLDGDLFAGVHAVALTDEEASAVEGEGYSTVIGCVAAGTGFGAYIGAGIGSLAGNTNRGMIIGARVGAVAGAVAGVAAGIAFPHLP